MITRQEVLEKGSKGTYFHYGTCEKTIGPRGGEKTKTERYRIASEVQTWKTRPNDFRFTARWGIDKSTFAVDQSNCQNLHWESDCTTEKGYLRVTRLL